jgi:molybdopterin synthase sulfur carrier subunit
MSTTDLSTTDPNAPDTSVTDAASGSPTRVEVRCFAASRAALGFATRTITLRAPEGPTVADVVAHLVAGTPSAEPVLARCSVLLDGRRALPSDPVPDGATLDLLPPFAGG